MADRDSRSAVGKALSLLAAFGRDAGMGLGVSELARRAELSKSTAFRLLATLEEFGAVERAGRSYRLGPMVHAFADPAMDRGTEAMRELLTPWLIQLYTATRQTVHMAMLDGPQVVYLNKLHGPHAVAAPSRIGGRAPAFCTGVGKALLAHDFDLTEQILAGDLPRWTPNTITDPAAIRAELEEVRRTGIAHDREEIQPGLTCIAAAVSGPDGKPVAALSVSGPTGIFDPGAHEKALRAVAFEAGRRLRVARRD